MSTAVKPRSRRAPRWLRESPLPWIAPAIILIAGVVVWPFIAMSLSAFQKIGPSGFVDGFNGLENFAALLREPALPGVVMRTIIWVIGVVIATMLLSLALAQLFNADFPGRKLTRMALIAPWAASVMMTAIIFRWALDPNNGVINLLMHDLGILESFNSNEADPLGSPTTAFAWMMVVAVFVSLPFTTYTLLAGLQGIPGDVYEAARLDGAGAFKTYFHVTLPLLRASIFVAVLINIINVFNSFPIIWEMTRGGPGYDTATTTVFMYQLKQSNIGESSALSMLNFALIAVVIVVYVRFTQKKGQVD